MSIGSIEQKFNEKKARGRPILQLSKLGGLDLIIKINCHSQEEERRGHEQWRDSQWLLEIHSCWPQGAGQGTQCEVLGSFKAAQGNVL